MKTYLLDVIKNRKKGFIPETIKLLLWLLSVLYSGVVRTRNFMFDLGLIRSHIIGKPVISIGNITAGGVGKTPVTEYIAKHLVSQGKKVAILTRGYMPGDIDFDAYKSDEAEMLKNKLADVDILVSPDRVSAAKNYLKKNDCDCFIMDDGFQHRKLARDLNIVAIDATNPWDNNFVIPRGLLREPISSLRRADIFIITKSDLGKENVSNIKDRLDKIVQGKTIVESAHEPIFIDDIRTSHPIELDFIKGKKVCLFSAIGDPESFKRTVENMGVEVADSIGFIDHHVYSDDDISTILSMCKKNDAKILITTKKDSVKIKGIMDRFKDDINLYVLEIQIKLVEGKDVLIERVDHLL